MEGDLPKIADFGLAGVVNTFSGTGFTLQCGTPEFTAPEIVEGKEYEGPAVSQWALQQSGVSEWHIGMLAVSTVDLTLGPNVHPDTSTVL